MSEHAPTNYVKIWAILLVLMFASLAGSEVGIQWVTLIAAFGIAVVKAWMVAVYFMHISMEKRYITYLVMTCLVFMFLLFAGVAPDVMKADGDNWVKPAWIEAEAAYAAGEHPAAGDHGAHH
ncbi:MAG: cytochrome C oxidase subunit IV family protein [Myxococcota bacterium]